MNIKALLSLVLGFVLICPLYGQLISIQPTSVSACEGDTAMFSVTLGTAPVPANFYYIQWQTKVTGTWINIPNSGGNGAYIFHSGLAAGVTYPFKVFPSTIPYQTGALFRCVVDQVGVPIGATSNEYSQKITLTLFSKPFVAVAQNGPLCKGETLLLNQGIVGNSPFTYSWFGPNNFFSISANPIIPNVNSTHDGRYELFVRDINGCTERAFINVDILQSPVFNTVLPDETFCKGETATFCMNASGGNGNLTYGWVRRDGNTWTTLMANSSCLSFVAGANGHTNGKVYAAVVEDSNGCRDTSNVGTLFVREANATSSTIPGQICEGEMGVSFCLDSTFSSYTWIVNGASFINNGRCIDLDFDQGNGSVSVHVEVENSVGCLDTLDQILSVSPLPIANLVPNYEQCETIPLANTAIFNLASLDSSIKAGNVNFVMIEWKNENGILIGNPDTYISDSGKVMAVVTDQVTGCTNSIEVSLAVMPKPKVDFSFAEECLGLETQFTNASSGPSGMNVWSFGDNGTSSLKDPSHLYGTAGKFEVSLAISTQFCSDTFTQSVNVLPLPEASAVTDEVCYSEATTFDARESDNNTSQPGVDNTGLNYWWTFEDQGTPFTFSDSFFEFEFKGRTQIVETMLVVENKEMCRDSILVPISLDLCGPPEPVFEVLRKIDDRGAVLIASIPGIETEMLNFVWFENGSGSTGDTLGNQSYIFVSDYSQTQEYRVEVTYKNPDCPCITRSTKRVGGSLPWDESRGLIASPNPSQGEFAIDWESPETGPVHIEIEDMAGRTVFSTKIHKTSNHFHYILRSYLPAGMYGLRLSIQPNQFHYTKIIIK